MYHHSNLENPERCFVTLFKKYIQLCPDTSQSDAFYLQPLNKPTSTCWYSTTTIARLCADAGITGHKTNHSLRATAVTILYQSGVDEQLVMERTGHKSLEGVRSYKHTSHEQHEALSDIMNRKVAKVDPTPTSSSYSALPHPLQTSLTHPDSEADDQQENTSIRSQQYSTNILKSTQKKTTTWNLYI